MAEENKAPVAQAPVAQPATAAPAAPAADAAPKSKKKLGLAVVGAVVVALGCVALMGGLFVFGLVSSPSSSALKTVSKTPVVSWFIPAEQKGKALLDTKIEARSEENFMEELFPTEGMLALTGSVSGVDAFGDLALGYEGKVSEAGLSGDMTISMTVEDEEFELDGSVIVKDDKLYFKINTLPEAYFESYGATEADIEEMSEEVVGQWYSADATGMTGMAEDFASSYSGSFDSDLSEEEQAEAIEVIKDFFAPDNAEYMGKEKVRSQNAYKFEYDITKEEIADLMVDLAAVTGEEEDRDDVLEDLEDLKSLVIGIWIDNSGEIVKMSVSAEYDDATISFAVELWDRGVEQTISEPEGDVKDYQELVQYLGL